MCEQLAKQIASGVDLGKSASNQEADSILKKEASSVQEGSFEDLFGN